MEPDNADSPLWQPEWERARELGRGIGESNPHPGRPSLLLNPYPWHSREWYEFEQGAREG
jgi:hypothetical protein